jgi:hypothetical protein
VREFFRVVEFPEAKRFFRVRKKNRRCNDRTRKRASARFVNAYGIARAGKLEFIFPFYRH